MQSWQQMGEGFDDYCNEVSNVTVISEDRWRTVGPKWGRADASRE
jgi:hypothetical protein